MAGKLGQPQYLIWERPEYRSPSPDHHGCGDVLYPDAPYRSLELPLKSSRLQVHGCFLDGSAICNKMNAQYVPVGRGLGLYSLFLDMKNTLRVFRVLFFTLSTLGVAYHFCTPALCELLLYKSRPYPFTGQTTGRLFSICKIEAC